jgi:hypothetical protein
MSVNGENIGPDTPLRLEEALKRAFPAGGITVAGLRKEIGRGRLDVEVIAGKQFTTLRAIEKMRELCRVQKEQDSGSNQKNGKTASSSVSQRGSSETKRAKSALAALQSNAKKLSANLPNTSAANTRSQPPATVIPLKSSS